MTCAQGMVQDERGCDTCECLPLPSETTASGVTSETTARTRTVTNGEPDTDSVDPLETTALETTADPNPNTPESHPDTTSDASSTSDTTSTMPATTKSVVVIVDVDASQGQGSDSSMSTGVLVTIIVVAAVVLLAAAAGVIIYNKGGASDTPRTNFENPIYASNAAYEGAPPADFSGEAEV